jgi:pantoate--beta-alanine ligase
MEVIHTVDWMKQAARQARDEGQVLGFVPTMGALHEGHLSLMRAARQRCSRLVASIFVNPKQFGPSEDIARYPRDFDGDRAKLEPEGVTYLFAPQVEEMYPTGFRTYVAVEGLSDRLCGKSRPGHFRGVTTVVLKLVEIVRPHFAFFGRKDAQQARIIQQMARDLNLDAEIVVCPIVRESDGLAMSSRNAYLLADERKAATVLHRSLCHARNLIEQGERSVPLLIAEMRKRIEAESLARIDYVEIVDASTLDPKLDLRGRCLVALAAFFGKARLIDNMMVEIAEGPAVFEL